MIGEALESFVNEVMSRAEIARADVVRLGRTVLPNGPSCHDEVDVLVALDRAVLHKDPAWSAFVIRAVVDHVVWESRPTGYIDAETASWLIASLSSGHGPTEVGIAIAFEVVREAEKADESLVSFVMRWSGGLQHDALMDAATCALI
jgi:hypothetical protein